MTMPPTSPNLDALLAHSGWVRALAHHLVDDPASADDVEQDAWVTALERPPSHGGNLRSWWSSVVRSSAGKGWREQKRRREVEESIANRGFDPAANSPESFTQRMETFRRLAYAVSQLPDPYGAAVYLRYFEEMSVREVAKQQGVPLATAQSHITRGLERLRGNLQESLGSDWRQCCLVFTLPLKAASWLTLGPTAILAMNTKTSAAAMAALLLLASLTVWATTDSAPNSGQDHALASATLDATMVPPVVEADALEPATALTPLPQLERENQTAALAYEGPFFEVIVRDAYSLEVLPFATVYLTDPSTWNLEQTRFMREHRPDPVRAAELFALDFQANADGVAKIPILPGQLNLNAVSGDRFAQHWQADAAKEGDVVELLAVPEISFDVWVKDESGQPVANVAIGFEASPLLYATHPARQVKTNEHGIAHFSHLEGRMKPENKAGCTVAMLIPCSTPQNQEVLSHELHGSTLTFTYPQTGTVRLKVASTDGRPIRNGIPITLQLHKEASGIIQSQSKFAANRQVSLQRSPMTRYVVDGMVEFEAVGLGTSLTVSTFDRQMMTYFVQDFAGPTQAGEVVDAALWFVGPSTSIPLQLVTQNGVAHAAGWVKSSISWVDAGETPMGMGMDLLVEENGFATLGLAPGSEEIKRLLLTVGPETLIGTPPSVVHLGMTVLEDLGSASERPALQLEIGGQTLLAGRIVDQNGHPYPGCLLRIYVEEDSLDGKLALSNYWNLQTDEDGRFAIEAPIAITGMHYTLFPQIKGEHFTRQLDPIAFTPGNAQAELTVNRLGRFEGRVLVDDASLYASMQLQLVTGVPSQAGSTYQYLEIDPRNGRFHSEPLKDARYTLLLRSKGSFERLAILEAPRQMATMEGGNLHLPDWDLRGQLFPHHLTVSLADGQVLERITLRFPMNDEYASIETASEISMLSRSPLLAMQVQAPGYRMKEVLCDGQSTVELGLGLRLRVQFSTSLPQREGLLWRLAIVTIDEQGNFQLQSGGRPFVVTAEEDHADLRVTSAGDWALVLQATTLENLNANNFEGVYEFDGKITYPLSILEGQQVQKFEMSLDSVQLEQLADQVLAD